MNRRNWLKTAATLGAGALFNPLHGMRISDAAPYTRADFGPDFEWGVATAAYQIEGGWNADGKGKSIWDTFSQKGKRIENRENGNVACDFYHRYPSDLELMANMHIPNNRFSLSWSRIFPNGVGRNNAKGVDFYHRVIDRTLELGMTPWITLYHWDLPQALEDKGGWTNRDIVHWFTEYSDFVTRTYGDRVKNWMVLNEPMAYTALGYLTGMHAPGHRSLAKFNKSVHYATLCQAEGGRVIRSNVSGSNVGTTISASHVDLWKDNEKHRKAANRIDAFVNRLFLEPALGLGYPVDRMPALKRIEKHMEPGDEKMMQFDFDFIGLQNYTRIMAKRSIFPPLVWAWQVPPKKRKVETTEMNWEIYPEGIYHLLKWLDSYENIPKIIVTENGAAFPDTPENGSVHDAKRTKFIQDYLGQVLRAKREGVNVQGYFVWTFMDNFEWAEGYRPRFGLVHVDFESQKRTVKDSGLWYKEFLGG